MIKLYVELNAEYSSSREYEISNELAELLRHWAFRDVWENLTEKERSANEFSLGIGNDEIDDLLRTQEDIPENVIGELKSIAAAADSEAYELAVGCALDENPPTELFLEEWMPEDLEDGSFTPSLSFEQFLENEDYDPSDEDFDEEWAREDYNEMIFNEYQEWVDALPPTKRALRWELDDWSIVGPHSYTFSRINKEAAGS